MPEGLEVEIFRRSASDAIGRQVQSVTVDRSQNQADEIIAVLPGEILEAVDRVGKHLILVFGPPASEDSEAELNNEDITNGMGSADGRLRLSIHFGMAGRLVVDGQAAIDELVYSSNRMASEWDRLVIEFTPASGGGSIRVNDPRRWSRFVLEPSDLPVGVDLFDVSAEAIEPRLAKRSAAIKSVLLDQDVIAGLGNMLVDEVLSEAGIDPRRPARDLAADEVRRLADSIRDLMPGLLASGGSHSGLLDPPHRSGVNPCPRCGGSLRREPVGGRTTAWCPDHQR